MYGRGFSAAEGRAFISEIGLGASEKGSSSRTSATAHSAARKRFVRCVLKSARIMSSSTMSAEPEIAASTMLLSLLFRPAEDLNQLVYLLAAQLVVRGHAAHHGAETAAVYPAEEEARFIQRGAVAAYLRTV